MRRSLRPIRLALALASAAPFTSSCVPEEPTRPVTIDFVGVVGDRPFECGATYEGIGTTESTLVGGDFRFYVHDVRVTTDDGAEHAVQLTDDGVWQNGGVALIDFEDGDGCDGGNAPTNARLVGAIPESAGAITGVRFRVGVPESRNHLDAATAPSPLNLTAMFWGWEAGYRFLRVEGATGGLPNWRLHVGATGCSGSARDGTRTCAQRNEAVVALDEYDPATDVIVADLASLLATSNVDEDGGGAPGCESGNGDPECAVLFEALGIGASSQSFFRVGGR